MRGPSAWTCAALITLGSACIDFGRDVQDFCVRNPSKCGATDGGVGGGTATGGGSATGGGAATGGGSGGSGGGAPTGGGSGGSGGTCAAELCRLDSAILPDVILSIWGPTKNDVWVAGDDLYHWQGSTPLARTTNPATYRIFAVNGTSATDVWAGGFDSPLTYHFDNTSTWRSKAFDAGDTVSGFYARSSSEVWMIAADHLYEWDGAKWNQRFTSDAGGGYYLQAIDSAPGLPLFAVAGSNVIKVDDAGYSIEDLQTAGSTLEGISVAPDGTLFVVGEYGTVQRKKAGTSTWETLTIDVPPHSTTDLWGVWARNADEAWLAGESGAILHWRLDAGFTGFDALPLDGGNRDILWFTLFGIGDELWLGGGKTFLGSGNFDAGCYAHFKLPY